MHQSFIKHKWIFTLFFIYKVRYCATLLSASDDDKLNEFTKLNNESELIFVSVSDNEISKMKNEQNFKVQVQYDSYKHVLMKRNVNESVMDNLVEDFNGDKDADKEETSSKNETSECKGAPEFCNLTKEEYVKMLNDYIYPQPYEWVLIGTHSIVFVIGLIGNALVCIAVYRNHSMRTVTNYFIVNLAVADFMVILFCLPPTVLWDVTETWFFGETLCKILLYFQSVSVTVSVLTLTFISVDRWYAICFPLRFKSTTGRAKTAILIIWLLSLLFNSPELAVLTVARAVELRFDLIHLLQCMPTWSAASDLSWHIVKVLFLYTIPLLLMTVAYCQIVKVLWRSDNVPGQAETMKLACAEQSQLRSRRKAAKMLVAVVLMFAICYFPVHLLSVLRYTLDMEQNDVITCLALLSHVLCYANSAINPLIYNFMSGKFRREYRRAFCCAPAGQPELVSTLSRGTTSKTRRKTQTMSLPTMTYCKNPGQCKNICDTTFMENGSKNGLLC